MYAPHTCLFSLNRSSIPKKKKNFAVSDGTLQSQTLAYILKTRHLQNKPSPLCYSMASLVNDTQATGNNAFPRDRTLSARTRRPRSSWRIDIVRLLLDNGVDINARPLREREDSALHLASYTGHLEVVQSLLEWGANVLLWDIYGKTPSQYALISGWLISEFGMGGV